ncbi:MAG: hypothetical protein MJZ25_13100 [Fibrobacter sp.]|nr:hypothetical protein [Fibrobacter sp.]
MTDEEKAEEYCDNLDLVKERNPELKTNDDFIKQAYLDGLAEGRKLGKEEQWKATEKAQKKTSARIRELEKENAELKEYVSRAGYRIDELKHEIDNLKEQNKAILEDNDTLNKWIDELKVQIEKTKNCVNCKHKNIYQYDFINECRLTGNQTNYEHKCDEWELAETIDEGKAEE